MGQTERSEALNALERVERSGWETDWATYDERPETFDSDIECIRQNLSQPVPDDQRWLQAQHDNALALIRMRGVPKTRAKYLPTALDVLLTRLDREITAQRAEIERLSALVAPED